MSALSRLGTEIVVAVAAPLADADESPFRYGAGGRFQVVTR